MIGRDYFERRAEALFELAQSTANPQVAATLIERANDLKAVVNELSAAPDMRHPASDVEPQD